ncbi:MAG: cyclase family protein [Acidobacteriaceae bacterium]
MKSKTIVVGYVLALALFLFAQRRPTVVATPSVFHGIVDLTHPSLGVDAHPASPGKMDEAKLRIANRESATQIEAPARVSKTLWSVDRIPPERLIGPLVVIDVRRQSDRDPDYQVSVEDIANWEHRYGEIPPGAMVMARTAWDSRWGSSKKYRNSDGHGVLHFPGYAEDAAKFLVEGRNAFGLGIDTLSVDNGPSKKLAVHQYVLAHSVFPLENVTNLERVPANGAVAVIAPTKVEGDAVSPVRILALVK